MIGSAILAVTTIASLAGAIGEPEARGALGAVATRAECASPEGETFSTAIVALADGRTRFSQVHAGDRRAELLVASGPAFQRGASQAAFEAAPAAVVPFVRGHEVHRMLLDLDRRFRAAAGATVEGPCVEAIQPDGARATICSAEGEALPARIELGPAAGDAAGRRVAIELGDWRELHGVRLPFAATFVDGAERWPYRFVEVLPFRLAPGATLPDEPGALFDRLGDLADLAAAHERALEAHRRGDVELLLADEAAAGTVSSRGELLSTDREGTREWLAPYLAATRFTRYEDVAVPVVAVSHDGTLGWLACRIAAEGVHTGADGVASPLAFGFSWVELYAARHGRWLRTGNASSAAP